jgi:hypothetical protein
VKSKRKDVGFFELGLPRLCVVTCSNRRSVSRFEAPRFVDSAAAAIPAPRQPRNFSGKVIWLECGADGRRPLAIIYLGLRPKVWMPGSKPYPIDLFELRHFRHNRDYASSGLGGTTTIDLQLPDYATRD